MRIPFRIRRLNPEQIAKPYWAEYDVDVDPTDRVLDGLEYIKSRVDDTLALRRSCAHGVCGSDAMMINGRNRLACRTLIKDAGRRVIVEPLRGFRVIKDLIVDMGPFFAKYRAVRPYLVNDDPPPPRTERRQTPQERACYDDTAKCILCGACTTACPIFWADGHYLGPAAIVAAHRFIFDSRDRARDERLAILAEADGVWRCRTTFSCSEACPREIDVTGAIQETKRAIVWRRPTSGVP